MPTPGGVVDRTTVDILDLVGEPEPIYNWVVPDVLERQDRLILTGEEGYGKSTFLRQFGVMVAAGIHPFTLESIQPQRVLLLDVENSREQIRKQSLRLAEAAGSKLKPEQFTYLVRPDGLDLQDLDDVTWLRRKVQAIEPDLLIAGPHYKLGNGDPSSEEVGKAVIKAVDLLRTEFDVAFVLEAHSPHAQNGNARPTRPYGWSGWIRWPEFGKHLARSGEFTSWRGDRAIRNWPAKFEWAEEWPWMVCGTNVYPELWEAIVHHCTVAGARLSERVLADRLKVGRTTIQRIKQAHSEAWIALPLDGGPGGPDA